MAAVARSPEPPDALSARVPCPFCGGLLHPIAGRCKHCKQDLATHPARAFGQGVSAPAIGPVALPPLASLPSSAARTVALGAAPPHANDGRAVRAGWLRNWPLLVILLAVVGMIVALVLLILPQRDSAIRRSNAPMSNDRMETGVLPGSGRAKVAPKPGVIDPWTGSGSTPTPPSDPSGPSSQVRPAPMPPDVPSDEPDQPGQIDEPDDLSAGIDPGDPLGEPSDVVTPDLVDPFADPRPRAPRNLPAENFSTAMVTRLCFRSATCGDDPLMRDLCMEALRSPPPRPPRCYDADVARECLRAIDRLPCAQPPQMTTPQSIPACFRLLTC
jgi:hypothetical protein